MPERLRQDDYPSRRELHAQQTLSSPQEKKDERPDQEVDCYEPGFHEKEAEKAIRKAPEVPPNVEFVERVRQAAWAWHQLEQNKHGMLVRQYYNKR